MCVSNVSTSAIHSSRHSMQVVKCAVYRVWVHMLIKYIVQAYELNNFQFSKSPLRDWIMRIVYIRSRMKAFLTNSSHPPPRYAPSCDWLDSLEEMSAVLELQCLLKKWRHTGLDYRPTPIMQCSWSQLIVIHVLSSWMIKYPHYYMGTRIEKTPTIYVSCWVWLSSHLTWRRSEQSAVHRSASDCCLLLVLLPDASVTCSPTISDKRRFEVIGTSVYTLSVGLLQCSAGRNDWLSNKTVQSVQNLHSVTQLLIIGIWYRHDV